MIAGEVAVTVDRATADRVRRRPHDAAVQFSSYRPGLLRYFRSRAQAADREDLAHDVLVSLHARNSATPIANVDGYVRTVAARALARNRRGDRQRMTAPIEAVNGHLLADVLTPEHILLARERLADTLRTLDTLSERTKRIFAMSRLDDMTYTAIATELGISVSAVEKQMMKAIKALGGARR